MSRKSEQAVVKAAMLWYRLTEIGTYETWMQRVGASKKLTEACAAHAKQTARAARRKSR